MITAVLIGFEYTRNTIPGTIIDLCLAYDYFSSIADEVILVTDISSVGNERQLVQAMSCGYGGPNLLSFADTLVKVARRTTTKAQLRDIFVELSSTPSNRIVVYYTGHGVNRNILLPNQDTIPMGDLFIYINKEGKEILWVNDCCEGGDLDLPFKLSSSMFLFTGRKRKYPPAKVILISSSSEGNSVASLCGSLFTCFFFRYVGEKNLGPIVTRVEQEIKKVRANHRSTITVHSSFPGYGCLYDWLLGTKREVITKNNHVKIIMK